MLPLATVTKTLNEQKLNVKLAIEGQAFASILVKLLCILSTTKKAQEVAIIPSQYTKF
jgi:hypothetical protein